MDDLPNADFDVVAAERFASLALACIHREYPNKIAHFLNSDQDVRPPRELTPAFYGCFDWHSAVHGHWLLVRLTRTFPDGSFSEKARKALAKSLTPANIAGEVLYMEGKGRGTFERPYGLAWLLQLAAELREWKDSQASEWFDALRPLEATAVKQIKKWLPKLPYPIRDGEHPQTAFAFSMILDWACIAGDKEMEELLVSRIRELYFKDRDCPLTYEPSGQDFLSPCIAEADLMRRILPPLQFAAWLGTFLPNIPLNGSSDWLLPGIVTDPSDGKLAHLDGLNLSRAWMLEGILSGLPPDDLRIPALQGAANIHREKGLRSVTGKHYEGGHWLGSFAVYLITKRGLSK